MKAGVGADKQINERKKLCHSWMSSVSASDRVTSLPRHLFRHEPSLPAPQQLWGAQVTNEIEFLRFPPVGSNNSDLMRQTDRRTDGERAVVELRDKYTPFICSATDLILSLLRWAHMQSSRAGCDLVTSWPLVTEPLIHTETNTADLFRLRCLLVCVCHHGDIWS